MLPRSAQDDKEGGTALALEAGPHSMHSARALEMVEILQPTKEAHQVVRLFVFKTVEAAATWKLRAGYFIAC
jgi:hypothetical protein